MNKLTTIVQGAVLLCSLLSPAHAQEERTIESLVESGHYDCIIKQLHSLRDTLPSDSIHHNTLDELLEETHELIALRKLVISLLPRHGHETQAIYSEREIRGIRSEKALHRHYNNVESYADALRKDVARLTKHIAMIQTGEGDELSFYICRLMINDFNPDFLPHAYDEQIKQLDEQYSKTNFSHLERTVEPPPLSAFHEVMDEQKRIRLLMTQRVVAREREFILDLELKKHELMKRENELKELRVRLRPYFERQERILRTMQQHEDRQADYVKRLKELRGLLDQNPQ